ncbi:MAG: two-component regulator propeller domain-containing protein [Candidatus Promineifilaceae bacterium]|nr:two-component regulator propeller domain-containing protein [Candidatus Promineifilaceae bacterium]
MGLSLSACAQQSRAEPAPPVPIPTELQVAESTRAGDYLPSARLHFDQVGLDQGLSQSSVHDILQDRYGFMWFATSGGLNRYDGYGMTVFENDPQEPSSLSDNTVLALWEDQRGILWAGTAHGGLNRFEADSETFAAYRHDASDEHSIPADRINDVYEDSAGQLWIGTTNGLALFDPARQAFRRFAPVHGSAQQPDPRNEITVILEHQNGLLWIGTAGGLFLFDWRTGEFTVPAGIKDELAAAGVLSLYEDQQGMLWIGAPVGLLALDSHSDTIRHYDAEENDPNGLIHPRVQAITADPSGTLWVGTGSGLERLTADQAGFIHYRHEPAAAGELSDDDVRALYIDRAGVFWVGTDIGGANRVDPWKEKFSHVTIQRERIKSISHPLVWSFAEDDRGALWIGTAEGLDRLDRRSGWLKHFNTNEAEPADGPLGGQVVALLQDSRGTLWVGARGGLSTLEPAGQRFHHFPVAAGQSEGVASAAISALAEDVYGSIWIGTLDSGLWRFDPEAGRFSHYQLPGTQSVSTDLLDNAIHSLVADDQVLWIGSSRGLFRLHLETLTFNHYQTDPRRPDSLSHDLVHTTYVDSAGRLWIGTAYGLNRLDQRSDTFTRYGVAEGLPNNAVLAIEEDDRGRLWISTRGGLSRFTPETGKFRNFDTSDGLQSLEFNVNASYRSQYGELCFGGINGFNCFYPDEVIDNPHPPPVVVTDFQVMNQSVTVGPDSPLRESVYRTRRIELDRRDAIIAFELAALHFSDPTANQYAFMMVGFDDDWNLVGHRRFATYTNLPAGDYTFRAIAANGDGVWNTDGVSLEVIVPVPFWQTPWFVALGALAVGVLVTGAYGLRMRSVAQHTRELATQVQTRTAEIEQRRQIAEGLREILVILNSNRSLSESLHHIVTQAARLTAAEDAIIFQCHPSRPLAIVATNPGGQIRYRATPALLSVTSEWLETAASSKTPLILPFLTAMQQADRDARTTLPHQALLGVPLFLDEALWGGLILFYKQPRSFTDEDLELGFTFADQATLAVANAELQEQVRASAVVSERNRLARDLHDAVTQTLFSASLLAETIPALWENDPDEGRALLGELRLLTRGALAEMRTLLLELRPAALEETALRDLLRQLAEAFTGRSGVPVRLELADTLHVTAPVRVALYRVAQEALNNISKHARPSGVELSLHQSGQAVHLEIRDDGQGFDPEAVKGDHLGLNIIRERVQSFGGRVRINSAPGRGTCLTVTYQEPVNRRVVKGTKHEES